MAFLNVFFLHLNVKIFSAQRDKSHLGGGSSIIHSQHCKSGRLLNMHHFINMLRLIWTVAQCIVLI